MPHHLPDDYVFFIEWYGGLSIDDPHSHYFQIAGLGPMTDDWYSDVLSSDGGLYENGLLLIGTLTFTREGILQFVKFFLDVAGTIKQYCVIAAGPLKPPYPNVVPILQSPQNHPTQWTKLADSFTGWLEQAAETRGTFGYI